MYNCNIARYTNNLKNFLQRFEQTKLLWKKKRKAENPRKNMQYSVTQNCGKRWWWWQRVVCKAVRVWLCVVCSKNVEFFCYSLKISVNQVIAQKTDKKRWELRWELLRLLATMFQVHRKGYTNVKKEEECSAQWKNPTKQLMCVYLHITHIHKQLFITLHYRCTATCSCHVSLMADGLE